MRHRTLQQLLIASSLTACLSASVHAAEETAPAPKRIDSQWQTIAGPQSASDKAASQPIKLTHDLRMDAPDHSPLRAHYTADGQLVLSHELSTEQVQRQIEEPK